MTALLYSPSIRTNCYSFTTYYPPIIVYNVAHTSQTFQHPLLRVPCVGSIGLSVRILGPIHPHFEHLGKVSGEEVDKHAAQNSRENAGTR
jgi:hypothetical protein